MLRSGRDAKWAQLDRILDDPLIYDLPWNPNKIEQRFGRIHRIGQTEVCHLWNLVAADTREGEVYARLLEKLEAAREALGGRVYDVLGELFEGTALKDLLFEAIQYGEREEVKARLFQQVDGAIDQEHLLELLRRRALTNDTMPEARVEELRLEMERAEAQRLQPCHVQSFFVEAFKHLGGRLKRREDGRWEITHVPAALRERDRQIGVGAAIQRKYERICFEKNRISQQPIAAFIYPGHPLLEAVISVVREKYGYLMKQGAVFVDDTDMCEVLSAVVLLEHDVRDGRPLATGKPHIVSEKLQFAAIGPDGNAVDSGTAPHLNLRPARPEEIALVEDDTMFGDKGDDVLYGDSGDDAIVGGSGDDILSGGVGADTLTGGAGKDQFEYNSLTEGGDFITDFDSGKDSFVFDADEFAGAFDDDGNVVFAEFDEAAAPQETSFVYDAGGDGEPGRLLYYDSEASDPGYTAIAEVSGDGVSAADITSAAG